MPSSVPPSVPLPVDVSASPRGDLRQLVAAGSMRFIVGFGDSREYVDALTGLTRVPRSPNWLLGVFSSDGASVPLVDIAAWAHHARPADWKYTDSHGTSHFAAVRAGARAGSATNVGRQLRALRFGMGANAWAIRVSEAPAVVALAASQATGISNRLPLSVSATNGRLMAHAETAWTLADNVAAIEVRWAELAQALRQELAGLSHVAPH